MDLLVSKKERGAEGLPYRVLELSYSYSALLALVGAEPSSV
jgi:hypothetical protein